MSTMRWIAVAVATGAVCVPASWASGALDDDLAVVKKATAGQTAEGAEADKGAPQKAKSPSPQWLKVRVTEKAGKKAKVSINVPLALVRALGDDCPLDWHFKAGHSGETRKIHLSDLLKALEAGQQIVEVDDEESTVRVWVE